MAITRELDKLTPEFKLKDAQAALILADISGVTVKGMEVTGLREAIEAVVKEKTYLVETATASADAGKTAEELAAEKAKAAEGGEGAKAPTAEELAKATAEAEASAQKAAELQALSAATIRESVGDGGIAAIPEALVGKIKSLQMRARQGDTRAALEYKRIRSKLIGGSA
jgi:hypothetical protein